ncbi:hypothetical protein THAR02_11022 [Trichoderma harzianum]|uniref:CCHC-type domain-containing protein n=1 Tax=Trichoderma harzianum TaxID=5544 RepID=A0A0F9ZUR0_TRIHA|nr:hypothetical protein THAR02_11022 [Trichoderma harzianum]
MSAPAQASRGKMAVTDFQILWDTIHSVVDEQKKRIDALEKEVRDLRAQLQQQQQEWQAVLPLRPRPAEVQEDATSAPPASVEADMAESSADPAPAATTTTTTTTTEVAVVSAPPAAAGQKRPIGACYGCGEPGHVKRHCPKRRGGQKINNYYYGVRAQRPVEFALRKFARIKKTNNNNNTTILL